MTDAVNPLRVAVAYHQAGLVVAAMSLNIAFESVTLDDAASDGTPSGSLNFGDLRAAFDGRSDSIKATRSMLVIARAGVLAEERSPARVTTEASRRTNEWVLEMVFAMYPETGRRHAADLNRQARRIVDGHGVAIGRIAEALMSHGSLTVSEVRSIMESEAS